MAKKKKKAKSLALKDLMQKGKVKEVIKVGTVQISNEAKGVVRELNRSVQICMGVGRLFGGIAIQLKNSYLQGIAHGKELRGDYNWDDKSMSFIKRPKEKKKKE